MRRRRTTEVFPDEVEDEAEDEAGDEPQSGPLRRCAVTRARLPKEAMIRFVVAPDGRIVPDLAARLPGRGIWLSARGDVIETARTRGAFAKAARAPVQVPADLLDMLRAALERRIGEHLGLARRAGQAVAGFVKAREWLQSGRAGLVIEAADGSVEERARLLGGWIGPVLVPLRGRELGAVFGRDHVAHVAVAQGRLGETIRNETERLAGLGTAERQ
ncbi:MAG: RNA-binding protein [Alphaproteobacteria bacterium]|nr:RNA-binding protein [Alphaproteobacteria bacterium]